MFIYESRVCEIVYRFLYVCWIPRVSGVSTTFALDDHYRSRTSRPRATDRALSSCEGCGYQVISEDLPRVNFQPTASHLFAAPWFSTPSLTSMELSDFEFRKLAECLDSTRTVSTVNDAWYNALNRPLKRIYHGWSAYMHSRKSLTATPVCYCALPPYILT